MALCVEARNSIHALARLLALVLEEGDLVGDRLELLSVFVNVAANESWDRTEGFLRPYKKIVGIDFWKRANTLYSSSESLRWKVSYRGRLVGDSTFQQEDQLQQIVNALIRAPGANTLSFSFFLPTDHARARALPASMPCPLSGDFKFRRGKLHLNILFRTHDVCRLGFPDLYFMRLLQREILARTRERAPQRFKEARQGELNLFFSRVFVLRSHRAMAERLMRAAERWETRGRSA